MENYKEAIFEIAKLVDEHKVEGNERGEICRRIVHIFWKYNLIHCKYNLVHHSALEDTCRHTKN